ncbi:type IV pilus modification PilV family protein [Gimesia fumaroli]|uniref:Prepilin-type N-terminal cleavage/methylation domain-containing protein n=1 Tax=Gimesia fumaroli TaxID=2527976 RepID=A0A518IJG9_9PLAN|nr:hypothetical protein [Gimesia fumaroli]QDV53239.1 hypothetical protein Enr17x_53110 [Gimesia fumaroli]
MRSLDRRIGKHGAHIATSNRRGVTLMEVLMSVMIMGLGVIPLATLFPLSVKRSAQATQLTNATILRYNAEAMLDAFPDRLLHDPDDNGNRNEHRYSSRKYVIDPIGYFLADNNTYQGRFGNDGQGGAFGVKRHAAGFTNEPTSMPPSTPRPDQPELATKFFSQQDSWQLQFEGTPTSNTLDSVTFDPGSPINELSTELLTEISQNAASGHPRGILSRLVIFDTDGKESQVRLLTGAIPPADLSSGIVQGFVDLPDNLRYVDSVGTGIVSKVRFEIQEQRYSFLLSVRHQPTRVAAVDVVVFFKRDFSPLSEVVHSVNNFVKYNPGDDGSPGVHDVDDNQDGTKDDPGELGWTGSDDEPNSEFVLNYNNKITGAPLNLSADNLRPALKRGGYIFDAKNARWYRIRKFVEDSSKTFATVTLDQPIAQDLRNSSGGTSNADGVIVRSDVVQVYALGNKLDPTP